MGHCPRKVFIKENGTYVALSYEAFCKRRQQDPGDWERLFLPIQGCLLETDRETYRAFYRDQERARYLAGVVHNPFHDPEAELEEAVLSRQMAAQLREAVSQLRPAERTLLFQLYCENRTERELAERYGVCRNAIHKRKVRILKKLKNFLHG